jgi:GDPmannose 4,6-dehydratase
VGLNWRDHVEKDESFVPEYRQLVSDPALIFSLGWRPRTSFHELAQMMMS